MPDPTQNAKVASAIKINLLPSNKKRITDAGQVFSWLLSGGRYLLIVTELLLFSAFASRFYFDDTIQHQIETGIQPRIATIDYLQKNLDEFKNLQARINTIKRTLPAGDTPATVLAEIQKLAPDGMLLEKLNLAAGELTFSGSVVTVDKLEVFKRAVSQSGVFKTLEITELGMSTDSGLVRFKAGTALKNYTPSPVEAVNVSKAL